MEIREEKVLLRKLVKERIRGLSKDYKKQASEAASKALMEFPAFRESDCILAYIATEEECDPALALRWARRQGKRIAYPRCMEDRRLRFYIPEDESSLKRNTYGIREPDPDRSQRILISCFYRGWPLMPRATGSDMVRDIMTGALQTAGP